jgi:hypothetical protein
MEYQLLSHQFCHFKACDFFDWMSIGAELTLNTNISCTNLLASELSLFMAISPMNKLVFVLSHVDHAQTGGLGSH